MHIVTSPTAMQQWSSAQRASGKSIGFVPTMGALHIGHTTLLDESSARNDRTVLSIFVNPLQFNQGSDYDTYPRTTEVDLEKARSHNVDCVFMPEVHDMYPPAATVRVSPGSAARGMEGDMRPGHFEGVTTIVSKLFNCVLPDRAYFGKKDYQQLAVVRQMVTDLNFPISVVGIDTVRESDGLALSSRNVRLTGLDREQSSILYRALSRAREIHEGGSTDAADMQNAIIETVHTADRARIEYVSVVDPDTLQSVTTTERGAVICIAAWFGDVRLIDNIELSQLQR